MRFSGCLYTCVLFTAHTTYIRLKRQPSATTISIFFLVAIVQQSRSLDSVLQGMRSSGLCADNPCYYKRQFTVRNGTEHVANVPISWPSTAISFLHIFDILVRFFRDDLTYLSYSSLISWWRWDTACHKYGFYKSIDSIFMWL